MLTRVLAGSAANPPVVSSGPEICKKLSATTPPASATMTCECPSKKLPPHAAGRACRVPASRSALRPHCRGFARRRQDEREEAQGDAKVTVREMPRLGRLLVAPASSRLIAGSWNGSPKSEDAGAAKKPLDEDSASCPGCNFCIALKRSAVTAKEAEGIRVGFSGLGSYPAYYSAPVKGGASAICPMFFAQPLGILSMLQK